MCIRHDSVQTPEKESGVGWKVFVRSKSGKLSGFMYYSYRPVNRWLKAIKPGEDIVNEGWHIYLLEEHAHYLSKQYENHVVRKVKFRKAHHQGLGDGGWNRSAPVVVADEIFILKKR